MRLNPTPYPVRNLALESAPSFNIISHWTTLDYLATEGLRYTASCAARQRAWKGIHVRFVKEIPNWTSAEVEA